MTQITVLMIILIATSIIIAINNLFAVKKYKGWHKDDSAMIRSLYDKNKELKEQNKELKKANINLYNSRSDLYNVIKENGIKMPLGKRKP
jgi:cell division protein FtsB